MTNVNLQIGGRTFSVACAAGEEDHITSLGRMIDTKLHAMGGAAGQTETRTLLFAALLLADELHEAQHGTGTPVPPSPPREDEALAATLEGIALRLEKCASHLEQLASDA